MVFYADPRWRSLALSGVEEDFRALHAEFIRRLPNESSLRTPPSRGSSINSA
jgi:hypothetical protein